MQQLNHNKVAFLGIGLMGQRMSRRLLDANIEVAVWNRSPAACEALYLLGASSLQLHNIQDYPIILMCLADDNAVKAVFEQIKPSLKKGQIIVDFSSLSVDCTQTLAKQAKALGVTWIDSPVSGGTQGAEQGTLVIFAGGDEDTIQQLSPIYQILSQRVTRMGDTSAGQATKICNQLIVAASSTLIAEAVALARAAGVDASLLAPALADGFADSKPFQILSPRMASHIFEPVQWKVQTLSKDLGNAMSLAQQNDLDLPVAASALKQLSKHQNQGFAEADLASFIKHIEA
jgi:3-hydroxyisobutyrate dehydrogenase